MDLSAKEVIYRDAAVSNFHSKIHATEQQIEIELLKIKSEENDRQKEDVNVILFNVGAPLKDNSLMYSKEQLIPFLQIATILDL